MCRAAISWQPVNLWRVQQAVDAGRLDPDARITMRELRDSGAAGKRVQHGFKLLAKVRTHGRHVRGNLVDEFNECPAIGRLCSLPLPSSSLASWLKACKSSTVSAYSESAYAHAAHTVVRRAPAGCRHPCT